MIMKGLLLVILLIPAIGFAQEQKTILVGETQYSFTGKRTYFHVETGESYYHIADGKLKCYDIGFWDYEKATFHQCEANLADLDLINARISDMYPEKAETYKVYLLTVDTKKLKNMVTCDMRTALDPTPGIDEMSSISLEFNRKEEAEAVLTALKTAAGK
jgi:hypothetical protein